MGEIITLKPPKPPEYCFTCPCGNQLFVLRPDARVECGHCKELGSRLLWGQYFVSDAGIETGPLPETQPSAT